MKEPAPVRDFSIRAARPADHQGLAELLAELLERDDMTASLASALNSNLLKLLSTPGSTLLVAENGATLLGFVSLWSRWGLLDDSPSALIDRLVVRRAYLKTSVPQALLEQALGAAQALGCSHIDFVPAEGSLEPIEALSGFGFSRSGERYGLELR